MLIKITCIQYVGLHVCGKSKRNVSRCNILQDICKSNRSLRLCRGLWFHSLDFRFYCYINKACFYCVRQMIAVTEPHCHWRALFSIGVTRKKAPIFRSIHLSIWWNAEFIPPERARHMIDQPPGPRAYSSGQRLHNITFSQGDGDVVAKDKKGAACLNVTPVWTAKGSISRFSKLELPVMQCHYSGNSGQGCSHKVQSPPRHALVLFDPSPQRN